MGVRDRVWDPGREVDVVRGAAPGISVFRVLGAVQCFVTGGRYLIQQVIKCLELNTYLSRTGTV